MDATQAKEVLQRQRAELLDRVERTHHHIHEREEVSADFAEQNIDRSNDDVVLQLDAEGREEIIQIDAALERIEEGRYGVCVECGRDINPERLDAIPHAAMCINCAREGDT